MPCLKAEHGCPPDVEVCEACETDLQNPLSRYSRLEGYKYEKWQRHLQRMQEYERFGLGVTGAELHRYRGPVSEPGHRNLRPEYSWAARRYSLYHNRSLVDAWMHRRGDGNNPCWNCSKLPWDHVVKTLEGFSNGVKILERSGTPCSVCRFFKDFIAVLPPETGAASLGRWKDWNLPVLYPPLFPKGSEPICWAYMDSPHADDAAWSSRLVTPADPLHASVVLQHVFPRHIDLEQVKSWLLECETTHGQGCASTRQAPVLKLKVIDVERMQVVTAPDDCVFAALSYVWGNGSDYPIDPNRLESSPQTIRQSILLVQSLGYRYLWIDRYCIDQGNAAEKHHQIMRMGDIYSAAHFTIVAAAGSNPDYGLPGVLPDNRKGPRFQIKDSVCFYEVPQTSALEDVAMSTWASRGWTYQESFLSRRRLVFTDRQVIYICNNTTHFEATTKPCLGIPDDAYPYDDAFIEFWLPQRHGKDGNLKTLHPILRAQNYLSGYSVRTLRYETDALNAIAGALNTLAKENVYHLWGVPVHVPELKPCSSSDSSNSGSKGEITLAWYHPKHCTRRPGFPTWSPLGWIGRVDWLDSEGLHTIAVQDLSLKSERDEPAPVRNTASDTLVQGLNYVLEPHAIELEAHTVHLTLFRDTEKLRPLKVDKGPGVRFSLNDKYTIAFWVHWDLPQTEVEGFSSLTGVFLPARGQMKRGKEACIVLRKVQDHYERVGISKAGVFPTEAPHGWDNQAESQVFDSTLWCLNNMEIKELSHGFNDSSGIEWWQRVVRTETIVIV